MGTWIVLIPAAVGALGLLLLILGIRGRRVGTAPHCRRCRFDLTGLYPEHQTCPECGANLATPRATTRGLRRRSWKLAIVGLLCFALPATLGVLAAQGLITRAKIAEALPTRALIALTIDRPDSWIGPEGRLELRRRLSASELDTHDAMRMADALIRLFEDPNYAWYSDHVDLFAFLGQWPSTPIEARRTYAEFLLDRILRTDQPWVDVWGSQLVLLREDGLISDSIWRETLTELITPRVWCSSGEVIEPGELVALRVSYLSSRLRRASGVHLEHREPFEDVERDPELKYFGRLAQIGTGLPGFGSGSDTALVTFPTSSAIEFIVRASYAEGQTEYDPDQIPDRLTHPSTVTAEARLTIESGAAALSPSDGLLTVEDWLRQRILPATPAGRESQPIAYPMRFPCRVAILARPGELSVRGTLRTIARDGTNTDVGTFDLTLEGDTCRSVWTHSSRTRPDIQTGTGGYGVLRLPEIGIELPGECFLSGARTRAVLVFDHVTLPDGRTFDAKASGAAPIEIEVPLDPDAGGFHW